MRTAKIRIISLKSKTFQQLFHIAGRGRQLGRFQRRQRLEALWSDGESHAALVLFAQLTLDQLLAFQGGYLLGRMRASEAQRRRQFPGAAAGLFPKLAQHHRLRKAYSKGVLKQPAVSFDSPGEVPEAADKAFLHNAT